ncbi:Nuclear receptor-binding protein [Schistosoma japonicum]|nr:Nuclear receptor-binding protein [Schistosoma japonicum]
MEFDNQKIEQDNEVSPELASVGDALSQQDTSDRKEDDEEEEEEEEEDKIVEKSHNSRFHKRNKRFPKQIEGVDNAFVAIEPKSGKEVIWNECILPEKKTDKENRYLSLIKKLKKNSHPFLVRFLDAWVSKTEEGPRKLVFITERLDECTLKQFLCNSAKNNRLWNRHVGQLLSVLMFLHRLGVAHGNLTKESIYYQNSGNLRVGLFALGRCLDQKSEAFDVYSLGVVSLEIAVWTPTEFPQNADLAERCQQMISRLDNSNQKSFIEACFDTVSATKGLIKRLLNHPAVTEVPTLKLLSARMIVNSMISTSSEDGSTNEPTGFVSLLKEYLNRYEDETVIMEVHFPHDGVVKSKSWKDFRSNFTLTSKYLEDVKNGFYPLFGCHWDAYQGEEEDNTFSNYAGVSGYPSSNGLASNLSNTSGTVKNDSSTSVINPSTCTSTTSSACAACKTSTTTKLTDFPIGSQLTLEDHTVVQCEDASKGCSSSSANASQMGLANHTPLMNSTCVPKAIDNDIKNDDVSITVGEISSVISILKTDEDIHALPKTTSSVNTPRPLELGHAELKFPDKPFVSTLDCSNEGDSCGQTTSTLSEHDGCLSSPKEQNRPRLTPPISEQQFDFVDTKQSEVIHNSEVISSTVNEKTSDGLILSDKHDSHSPEPEDDDGEVDDDDDDKDDEDDDNEDDDEDDDEKRVVEPVERYEPQTVHVNPPERAPSHPALFTHCQYLYVGAGRWQVYVQMWFVEDRLKRETYVQVFDSEWHDYERVADLFEASRCLNPVDRHNLVRLLALARHNCALIDGELQFPGPIASRQSNFDALELHEKLVALHLHQQAKERLTSRDSGLAKSSIHSSSATPNNESGPIATNNHDQNVSDILSIDRQINHVPITNEVQACAEHITQVQLHQRADQTQDPPTPCPVSVVGLSDIDGGTRENQDPGKNQKVKNDTNNNALFLDVSSLAPRNSYCALCDTHDYLHQIHLPAYLISPCYHCREFLAHEAKITPEILLDLHLQHNIPWPGFLQARFGIPIDGRSTEELIAYDCRWRSRQPCRCLASIDGSLLPPCVEFPWLAPTGSLEVTDISANQNKLNKRDSLDTPPITEMFSSATTDPRTFDLSATAQAQTTQTNQSVSTSTSNSVNANTTSTTGNSSICFKPVLPCSNRHIRGAPITCCHGIHFPLIGIPNVSNSCINQSTDTGYIPSTDQSDPQSTTDKGSVGLTQETQQLPPSINDVSS